MNLYQRLAGRFPLGDSAGSILSVLDSHLRISPPIYPNVPRAVQGVVD